MKNHHDKILMNAYTGKLENQINLDWQYLIQRHFEAMGGKAYFLQKWLRHYCYTS